MLYRLCHSTHACAIPTRPLYMQVYIKRLKYPQVVSVLKMLIVGTHSDTHSERYRKKNLDSMGTQQLIIFFSSMYIFKFSDYRKMIKLTNNYIPSTQQ